jgi:hypothetical protein
MTLRYLQAMSSKCLIIGILPDEMRDLFEYMPIIEIDFSDPINQILIILENYNQYIDLIEKNYSEVIKNHQWKNRWYNMSELILTELNN